MSHNPFDLSIDHRDYLGKELQEKHGERIRHHTAAMLRSYRRHAAKHGLPKILLDREHDHYQALTESGPVYLIPVFKSHPGIGSFRGLSILWRASVGITHPASRWHPEESDENPLCDGENLIDCIFAARAILALHTINNHIFGDEMYAHHLRELRWNDEAGHLKAATA